MLATRVLPALTVLPFDADVAHLYGRSAPDSLTTERAWPTPTCRSPRRPFTSLDLVTGTLKHVARVHELTIRPLREGA